MSYLLVFHTHRFLKTHRLYRCTFRFLVSEDSSDWCLRLVHHHATSTTRDTCRPQTCTHLPCLCLLVRSTLSSSWEGKEKFKYTSSLNTRQAKLHLRMTLSEASAHYKRYIITIMIKGCPSLFGSHGNVLSTFPKAKLLL